MVAIAELAGITLDPWERYVLMGTHRVDDNGIYLHKQVGLIVPRQNGKGLILEALGLYWLFVADEPLVLHSSHEFKTAADAYKRLRQRIGCLPYSLRCKVKKFNDSHGHEGVLMNDGREYKFIARTRGSGRGFPATKIVLDEAYELADIELEAILPTLTAAENGQVWFTSSPVNKNKHPNGRALSKVRHRGVTGENAGWLAYFEWSCPDDLSKLEYHDSKWHKVANPGYDYRKGMPEELRSEFDLMGLESFGQEHLGIGDWFPMEDGGGVISVADWRALTDPQSRIVGRCLFALHIAPYGRKTAIAACGLNAEGKFHVEVIKARVGTSWIKDYLKERCERWRPMAVLYDPRTASASIANDLMAAKIPLEEIKSTQVAAAFSEFYDKCVMQKCVTHRDQPSVDEALLDAQARDRGDGMTWDVKHSKSDITGLQALTYALWGFSTKNVRNSDPVMNCW